MIKRHIEKQVKKSLKEFPVVSITGPRQSGKTTLIRNLFKNYEYYNLEDPNTKLMFEEDPKNFINANSYKVVIDEVQKVPNLLSYIQVTVDEVHKNGMYIISGSENLLLSAKISQSLAGRVAILKLLPFSIEELVNSKLLGKDAFTQILKGFYPRIYDMGTPFTDFYSNYIETYVERDVRSIKNISDISTFQRFMQLLAGRIGQLFNASDISNILGVDSKTVNGWLSVLEATYIVFRLSPYYKNFGKRIIKTPKVYFYDTGLASYLFGIDSKTEMKTHFARGQLFENLIIADLYKHIFNNRLNIRPYFWRDKTGNEIDLLLDKGSKIDLVEIKASATYKNEFTKNFDYWDNLTDVPKGKKFVVYSGDMNFKSSKYELVTWDSVFNIWSKL